jgi:hypothetical protein
MSYSAITHFIENIGDAWQSVFPHDDSAKNMLHDSSREALVYMVEECGVPLDQILILQRERRRLWPSH